MAHQDCGGGYSTRRRLPRHYPTSRLPFVPASAIDVLPSRLVKFLPRLPNPADPYSIPIVVAKIVIETKESMVTPAETAIAAMLDDDDATNGSLLSCDSCNCQKQYLNGCGCCLLALLGCFDARTWPHAIAIVDKTRWVAKLLLLQLVED